MTSYSSTTSQHIYPMRQVGLSLYLNKVLFTIVVFFFFNKRTQLSSLFIYLFWSFLCTYCNTVGKKWCWITFTSLEQLPRDWDLVRALFCLFIIVIRWCVGPPYGYCAPPCSQKALEIWSYPFFFSFYTPTQNTEPSYMDSSSQTFIRNRKYIRDLTTAKDLSEMETNSDFIFVYILAIVFGRFSHPWKYFSLLHDSTVDVRKNSTNQWYHFAAGVFFRGRWTENAEKQDWERKTVRHSFLPAEDAQHPEDSC